MVIDRKKKTEMINLPQCRYDSTSITVVKEFMYSYET